MRYLGVFLKEDTNFINQEHRYFDIVLPPSTSAEDVVREWQAKGIYWNGKRGYPWHSVHLLAIWDDIKISG